MDSTPTPQGNSTPIEPATSRVLLSTRVSGLKVYRVKLVNGPGDGQESICSHNTVYHDGERYVRGSDDRYYHQPHAGGKN